MAEMEFASPGMRDRSRSRSPFPASKLKFNNGRHDSRSPSPDPRSRDQYESRRKRNESGSPIPSQTRRPQSISPSAPHDSRSLSRSPRRSPVARSRSTSPGRDDVMNPGNTLFVTGLSFRVTERDLKHLFSKEGKVVDCNVVTHPHTRASRGFAFITMDTVYDANRCIKYLDQSILDGRKLKIEKSRRKRPRTPTPGQYQGFKNSDNFRGGDRGDRYGSRYRDECYPRERYCSRYERSVYRGSRDYYSPPRQSRSRSPYYSRR